MTDWVDVGKSSTLHAFRYDEVTGELLVEFLNGSVYAYVVDESIYTDLLTCTNGGTNISPGQYFARYIRSVFEGCKVVEKL